ncbi:hypothetical protein H0X48_05155 [Candidatus Dependentiae bacterium]|nr:hypothetical protein [Candidatus Dependentiae bacterium]
MKFLSLLILVVSTFYGTITTAHGSLYLQAVTRSTLSSSQEEHLVHIIKDFFDLHTYPNKSFADFAQDIINLLGSHAAYKTFCADLNKYKYTSNTLLLGAYLGQYKYLMPEKVKRIIAQKKTTEILRVIKERMKKNTQ